MAETQTEELGLEEKEIKEEIVSIKEEILPSSTVDDTCSVDTDMKGKLKNNFNFLKTMKFFTNIYIELKISKIQPPPPLYKEVGNSGLS